MLIDIDKYKELIDNDNIKSMFFNVDTNEVVIIDDDRNNYKLNYNDYKEYIKNTTK